MDSDISYWFVGALWGGTDDQTERFLTDGVWENGYDDKHLELVKTIKPGDRIAIKASFTQKNDLPFQSNGSTASVMAVKARGTVTSNEGDGRRISVEWEPLTPEKRWYFYTHRGTIWQVKANRWLGKGLIDFTFNDAEQDYDRFRNDPYWKERFGDNPNDSKLPWTKFYEEFATKLLNHKDDRAPLVDKLHEISQQVDGFTPLNDKGNNDAVFAIKDICPFTIMGTFNRGITDSNRKTIARKLAALLGVESEIPTSFDGIPVLNNQKSWFFAYDYERADRDIDKLWDVFDAAVNFSDGDADEFGSHFSEAYDAVTEVKNVGWNLTMGLYWIRPWNFLPLDGNSQRYIQEKLGTFIPKNGPKGRCNSSDYLKVLNSIESRFKEDTFPVHSFPELSFEAWRYQPPSIAGQSAETWKSKIYSLIKELCAAGNSPHFSKQQFLDNYLVDLQKDYPENKTIPQTVSQNMQLLRDEDVLEFDGNDNYTWLEYNLDENNGSRVTATIAETYSLSDIVSDGCFLQASDLEKTINILQRKKNIILQGPPGTGKTWLAKRIAYALIGQKSEERVRAVQFHPNLSYEDFIRGWRPAGGNEGLELVNGPFLEMLYLAQNNAENNYVIVIEEVNRGNPAQIFGEMLTLLEADKRTPDEALELSYGEGTNKRVFIPSNLYIIGTMNIADRSLALVDLALRRRFAFIDLIPQLGENWREWLSHKFDFDAAQITDIEKRILSLNKQISEDPTLGTQFQIGHSYVTPVGTEKIEVHSWFEEVINTEIYPLLQEYFFDIPEKAENLKSTLLEGW